MGEHAEGTVPLTCINISILPRTIDYLRQYRHVPPPPPSCSSSSPHRGPRLTDHRRHHYCRAELFILSHRHLTYHPHCHLQPHSHSHSHSRSLALAVTLPLPFPLPFPLPSPCILYILPVIYCAHQPVYCTTLPIAPSYLPHCLICCIALSTVPSA